MTHETRGGEAYDGPNQGVPDQTHLGEIPAIAGVDTGSSNADVPTTDSGQPSVINSQDAEHGERYVPEREVPVAGIAPEAGALAFGDVVADGRPEAEQAAPETIIVDLGLSGDSRTIDGNLSDDTVTTPADTVHWDAATGEWVDAEPDNDNDATPADDWKNQTDMGARDVVDFIVPLEDGTDQATKPEPVVAAPEQAAEPPRAAYTMPIMDVVADGRPEAEQAAPETAADEPARQADADVRAAPVDAPAPTVEAPASDTPDVVAPVTAPVSGESVPESPELPKMTGVNPEPIIDRRQAAPTPTETARQQSDDDERFEPEPVPASKPAVASAEYHDKALVLDGVLGAVMSPVALAAGTPLGTKLAVDGAKQAHVPKSKLGKFASRLMDKSLSRIGLEIPKKIEITYHDANNPGHNSVGTVRLTASELQALQAGIQSGDVGTTVVGRRTLSPRAYYVRTKLTGKIM